MQSIPVLICEGCDDSLIAQSLQLQRELAFSAFLSVCISHFWHFSQVWECVLHPMLQFNLVAKQFICGKGSLRPRKQKAEKTHLAQKSLKAKITLHPTFNVSVRIAQTKLHKKQTKRNFLLGLKKFFAFTRRGNGCWWRNELLREFSAFTIWFPSMSPLFSTMSPLLCKQENACNLSASLLQSHSFCKRLLT